MIIEFIICFSDHTWTTQRRDYTDVPDDVVEDFCSTLETEGYDRYSEIAFVDVYHMEEDGL